MLQRAKELGPESAIIHTDLGVAFIHAKRYVDAEEPIQRALELEPGFPRAQQQQAFLDMLSGRRPRMAMNIETLGDWWAGRLLIAYADAVFGRRDRAVGAVEREILISGGTEQVGLYPSLYIAAVYVSLGSHDEALDWIQRAVDRGLSGGPISLQVSPQLDPLRSNPRFEALRASMGFPD